MHALNAITAIIEDRGLSFSQDDLDEITMLSVEVPLEDSDALATAMGAVELIIRDPLYTGDVDPVE